MHERLACTLWLVFAGSLYECSSGNELLCKGGYGIALTQTVRLNAAITIYCQSFNSFTVSNLRYTLEMLLLVRCGSYHSVISLWLIITQVSLQP